MSYLEIEIFLFLFFTIFMKVFGKRFYEVDGKMYICNLL